MKKITNFFFSIILLLIVNIICAQSTVNNFKMFDIRNSSCEVFNSLNIELEGPSYNNGFSSLRKNQQIKYPLQTQNSIDGFINDFNVTLDKTKKRYESQEFLWKTGKEIGKYGLSVLGNYAQALPTKHLTNFLMPAIEQGYELYVDNEIQKGMDLHKDEIDKIIKDRINLLYTNGIDLTTSTDKKAFEDMFALAHGEIPALNREQYAIFNKELTKRAYDFISSNREQIQLLDLRTTKQYEDIKLQVNSKIEDFQKQITDDLDSKLKELGNSIVKLTEGQKRIFKTLDNIQVRVKENESRISTLEKNMILFKDDIVQLKTIQDEHSKLIIQNSLQIDILSGYVFQNLNTTEKINALEKGDFDHVFSTNDDKIKKNKLLNELKEIKNKETIISVSNDIENYSKAVYSGLVNTGILKGEDSKNVGIFINSVSVLTGAARVYAGDASGLMSVVTGLGGLFSKPQDSPESQILKQMHTYMKIRFDSIDHHLSIIETKIDTLSNITLDMHKSMALSFQYTGNQIERINRKNDYLLNHSSYLIFKDYKNCLDQTKVWETNINTITTYSDITNSFNPVCKKCLDGLNDFLAGESIQAPFFLSANPNYKNIDVIDFEINDIYKPTNQLFTIFYPSPSSKAIYALMFPFSLTSDTNKSLYYLNKMDYLKEIDNEIVLNEYYNYQLINEFTNNLITFSPFFIVQSNSSDFKPQSINEYLINNKLNKNNQTLQENRLLKILELIQYSVAQQSMLSGNLMLDPIYATLFNYSTDVEAKNLAIKVLNNNKLLATNFSIYLINKNVDLTDKLKVQSLYNTASVDTKSLENLNSLITLNDIKFEIDANNQKLKLTFNREGQKITILCPEFLTILENKMINSEALYTLMDSRQKINSKLIDLTFTKNLSPPSTIEKFKYYYSTKTKNE
ncbi:hypothetical protein GKZ90_0001170 [Flavobacterium sp. MC2016-06]|jgi:hypothetical protein|uniref:hypothetical protein n=1 Tax=Flavobacterium sp. MC2016-06 TaxID=2676308 RepID=UPI0012BA60EC|nr:hypothetical protein [Flavobacterium sp. MC2016-06]MBU3859078.1 hypothetical protein [Flavobacterium sp. MC2016-06]